ncbi:MAG: tRNA pseudouridine(55) synthase TruB [Clostridiales bacterium GWF2_36_10]|nr:MAG: tRNA pseudouridine(55) synthase TruB [Clostridiales bacterium GWF2_36_10]
MLLEEPKIKIVPGIYNVYKPQGWTSFDVVNKMKRMSVDKKIGHAGTLDPMATGVLIVAVGRVYTKQISQFMEKKKGYLAEITLGITTDSYDLEGKIISMKQVDPINKKDISSILNNYRGNIMQKPPIYSALKKDGKKLYQYARKNQEVEIEERPVSIYELELLDFKNNKYPKLIIKTMVSKGTYIRSLAYDIGKDLGVGAVLSGLCRYCIGDYNVEDAKSLDQFY